MSYVKYVVIGVFGIGFVVGGAALLAALVDNDGSGDNFGTIFGAAVAISGIVLGIGTSIASAATFLARRE
jgi:hypothetical protein